jgi:hypothetical protein
VWYVDIIKRDNKKAIRVQLLSFLKIKKKYWVALKFLFEADYEIKWLVITSGKREIIRTF